MTDNRIVKASFRDPSGFVYKLGGVLYRQINSEYESNYRQLMESGLYETLTSRGLLIEHEEVDSSLALDGNACVVIRPDPVRFISYPYEWCFGQLQEAALATLEIQSIALSYGFTLRDASAFNIQFHGGKCSLIDTLSFEPYQEGAPWVAYRQFCQHFLAPLALMEYSDVSLSKLARLHIDGVPLELASKLLPARTYMRFALLVHLHLHSWSQRRYANSAKVPSKGRSISRQSLNGLIDSLQSATKSLHWEPEGTEWADYYNNTNYSDAAAEAKKQMVEEYLDLTAPSVVWDLGANTGAFACLASQRGIETIAFDVDPAAVERCYRASRKIQDTHLLPLVMDLTNPSAALGWHHCERMSLLQRGPANLVMALALIHHLVIANNVPFARCADLFANTCEWLIIEFVPKSDSQVQRMLMTRHDVFPDYCIESFESAFCSRFAIERKTPLPACDRVLYLMRKWYSS